MMNWIAVLPISIAQYMNVHSLYECHIYLLIFTDIDILHLILATLKGTTVNDIFRFNYLQPPGLICCRVKPSCNRTSTISRNLCRTQDVITDVHYIAEYLSPNSIYINVHLVACQ